MDSINLADFQPETFTYKRFTALLDSKSFILTFIPDNPKSSGFFGNIIAFCF